MTPTSENQALAQAELALRMVCLDLPYLAGLAHRVEVVCDRRVQMAGVTSFGLIVLHPENFCELSLGDAQFLMAHELMHLALNHHQRMDRSLDRWAYNVVQDFIVNDMLVVELRRFPPHGGLWYRGASQRSVEEIMLDLQRRGVDIRRPTWDPDWEQTKKESFIEGVPDTAVAQGLARAGLLSPQGREPGGLNGPLPYDLISDELSRDWFPKRWQSKGDLVRQEAAKALPQAALLHELGKRDWGISPGLYSSTASAHRSLHIPPWEEAIQSWLESQLPPVRSWGRPSRRTGVRTDVVLPGRRRVGGTLNIVLDTSGSMTRVLAYLLGVLRSFCETLNIPEIRVVQCDTRVTNDERVEPEQLESYRLLGFGGSDMSPAMDLLAQDSEVESVLVITDGAIHYPRQTPPYGVLWAITGGYRFHPPYGLVLNVQEPE